MVLRFTNTAILALIVVLTLTGLYGLVFSLQRWAGVRLVDLLQAAGMTRPAKLVGLEAVGVMAICTAQLNLKRSCSPPTLAASRWPTGTASRCGRLSLRGGAGFGSSG